MTMKSTAFCLPAVNNGLALANPSGLPWITTNDTQDRYLADYGGSQFDLAELAPYLKGKVTPSASELNAWFAEHGWTMNLDFPADGLGIGSIFDLLVDWSVPGKKKDYGICIGPRSERNWYAGAEMRPSDGGLKGHRLAGYEHPLFELSTTQEGWKVFLVEADGPVDALDLPKRAASLLALDRLSGDFSKLEFPIVNLETTVDIGWMAGLAVENGSFQIDEAVKQVKLTLDDKGARAQSAVAYAMRGMENGVYTIDKPFYVMFCREGMALPAFVALSAPDSWTKLPD